MLEQRKAREKNAQTKNSTIRDPSQIRGLVMDNACTQSIEEWRRWVEHQPFALGSEHSNVIKNRRKENAKCNKHYYEIFDISEE
jgi:hypothetical protein